LLIAAAAMALAHPLDGPSSQPIGPMELEIIQFRQAIVDAVKAKDAARLREIYADGFTHTHGSGKVDGKDTRIVAVLAGDPRSKWRRRTSLASAPSAPTRRSSPAAARS
jgi:hypothetical protein